MNWTLKGQQVGHYLYDFVLTTASTTLGLGFSFLFFFFSEVTLWFSNSNLTWDWVTNVLQHNRKMCHSSADWTIFWILLELNLWCETVIIYDHRWGNINLFYLLLIINDHNHASIKAGTSAYSTKIQALHSKADHQFWGYLIFFFRHHSKSR